MIPRAWNRFWFSEGSLLRLAYFRILLMVLCLMDLIGYSGPAFANASRVSEGAPLVNWRPIYLFSALGMEPMGTETAELVFTIAIVAVVFALLGLFTRTACLVAGLLVLYWTAYCYSFDKPHHEKIAMAFALLALPWAPVGARFSLDALLRRLRLARAGEAPTLPAISEEAMFPLLLTQLSVVFGYTFAGWTKLAVSGLEWANGYTLMAILLGYDNTLSQTLSSSVEVARALSIGALTLQVTFPVVMFLPRLRWIYLPAAISFHLATWLSMGGAHYITLWFMMIAFLPLERIPAWVREGLHGTFLPGRVLRPLLVILPALGTTWVLFLVLPKWLLIFLAVPVWGFLLSLSNRPKLTVQLPSSALTTRALVEALDWSGRLTLRQAPGGQGELSVQREGGETLTGRAARVALLRNLPLTTWLAGLAR